MIINVAISLGELIDKISILLIKKKNIKDQKKLEFIKQELEILQNTLDQSLDNKKIEFYLNKLISINSQLWKIEDEIRDCEREKNFDQKFIDLARSVYITNDKRSAIKLEINNLFGSKLVEVNSYEKY